MKNILFANILLALLFSQTACDEDTFSQVVEVDIPEHESAIVLNGIWTNQDTVLYLSVSNSLGIIDKEEYTYPTDAVVKLYKDGNFESDFIYSQIHQRYILPDGIFTAEEGALYKIEAQFGNFKEVSTSQEMPSKVEIIDVEYEKNGAPGEFGETMDKHIISFEDPSNQDNYYTVNAYKEGMHLDYIPNSIPPAYDTIRQLQRLYFESDDPTVTWSPLGLIFSDKAFNGQLYNFRATSYSWWGNQEEEDEKILYKLYNISRETYLYNKSLNAYYNSQDNPFAEPATVFSNVTDGYGVFGLMAVDTLTLTP